MLENQLFKLGQVLITPTASALLRDYSGKTGFTERSIELYLLVRHVTGDWVSMGDDDQAQNRFAVEHGERILSSYTLAAIGTVWVITEADRSATTILLPSDC